MRDLRLIGVHDDGERLVLADGDGTRFGLRIDESLRAAARRDRPALGQQQIAMEGGASPREVQAMIRAGLTAEDVATRSGWTVEKVRRFEGPVLAEREFVAAKAQQCAVEPRGDRPVTLRMRAEGRLRERGVEPSAAEWDSARDGSGTWSVSLSFAAGGRSRTATWRYEPLGGSVLPTNDEARWISEPDSIGPIPTPHVLPGDDPSSVVFDIEADGEGRPRGRHRRPDEPIDLMAAMREHSRQGRRPRRRGPSTTPAGVTESADALPIEDLALDPSLVAEPPVARGAHPVEAHLDDLSLLGSEDVPVPESHESTVNPTAADPMPDLDDDAVSESGPGPDTGSAAPVSGRRSGRPKVPTWDEIVFGTKGSGQG